MRVYVDGAPRGVDDGYRSELIPGVSSSVDARRLAEEIAFAGARLAELAGGDPPGPYGQARRLARDGETERAIWICFLCAYLCPLAGAEPEPFAGIEAALAASQGQPAAIDLDGVPLGPRSSHDPARGSETLRAYMSFLARAGSQAAAIEGDPDWSPQRRFARIFERLAMPGLSRVARFELLTLLGALGVQRLSADSLHLAAAETAARPGGAASAAAPGHAGAAGHGIAARAAGDPVLLAAKRVFGIGDAFNLERRATSLADACGAPLESLDLALYNWSAAERATLGAGERLSDLEILSATLAALRLPPD